jgi:hypothetical protein
MKLLLNETQECLAGVKVNYFSNGVTDLADKRKIRLLTRALCRLQVHGLE